MAESWSYVAHTRTHEEMIVVKATSTEKVDIDAVRARQEAAFAMITALNRPRGTEGSREWIMSIPVREDWDPDVMIGKSLRDINGLLDALEAEREKVTKVKSAAKKLIADLDDECQKWMSQNAYGAEGSPVPRHSGAKMMWNEIEEHLGAS